MAKCRFLLFLTTAADAVINREAPNRPVTHEYPACGISEQFLTELN
jgi:hypothetical protein